MMGQSMTGQGMHPGMMTSQMMAECKQMESQHEKAISKWHSMESDLNKKVQKMNEATGEAKVQAMAKVIDDLVQQRNEMINHVLKMHEQMVSHMEHMHGMNGQGMGAMGSAGPMSESSSKTDSSEK